MDNSKFKNSVLGDIYEYGGLVIIGLTFILFICYGFKIVFQGKPQPTQVSITKNHTPSYPQIFADIKKRNRTDSLLTNLLIEKENFIDSIQILNRKIEVVGIDNGDTENKVKIIASIIAVIVAVVGFFGFKSLNDIRENTIKNSQIEAQEIAKTAVKENLEKFRSDIASLKELVSSIEETNNQRFEDIEKTIDELNKVTIILKKSEAKDTPHNGGNGDGGGDGGDGDDGRGGDEGGGDDDGGDGDGGVSGDLPPVIIIKQEDTHPEEKLIPKNKENETERKSTDQDANVFNLIELHDK